MKNILILTCLFIFSNINSQNKSTDVLGYYMNPTGEAILKIYENTGKFFGKLVWMKKPEKLDDKNPDKSKQSQKILGSTIMHDFVFDGDDVWKNGKIYDPKNGKTYDCKITRDEKGNLSIRGFIGISLLGRTDYFVKVNFKE